MTQKRNSLWSMWATSGVAGARGTAVDDDGSWISIVMMPFSKYWPKELTILVNFPQHPEHVCVMSMETEVRSRMTLYLS